MCFTLYYKRWIKNDRIVDNNMHFKNWEEADNDDERD